jgi:hypothetical protein
MTALPAARAETALSHASDAPPPQIPAHTADPRDVDAGDRLLEDADVERILAAV